MKVTPEQAVLCRRFEAETVAALPALNSGVSRSMLVRGDRVVWPVYGIRHAVERNTTGWYLWTGEYSDAADFYVPWHTSHLYEQWPELAPYLALPPGWGFIVAPNYEDVWFDPSRG